MTATQTVVVDYIGAVVAAMRDNPIKPNEPHYLYGHRAELDQRLRGKGKNSEEKFEKYPLVALKLDFEEKVEGGFLKLNLNLVIVASTDKVAYTDERYEKVIKPILYPLYQKFMLKLRDSGLFTWDSGEEEPKHTKTDRPYWGVTGKEGNEANIFSDPLDAIEISELEINCKSKSC